MRKIDRTGEKITSNEGYLMTIKEYFNANNMTIEFEDGTLCYNKIYKDFIKGGISKDGQRLVKRVGETNYNNNKELMTIIKYNNHNDIWIKFENGYICKHRKYTDFKKGNIKNLYSPFVASKGFMGDGKYASNTHPLIYEKWNKMLDRCYNKNKFKKAPTYIDCEVCDEWLNFQNFAKWYEENIWDEKHLVLDKDILIKGNKIYSPNTCVLVNSRLNNLYARKVVGSKRGNCVIGVHYRKDSNVYYSRCNNTHLGVYNTELEAFQAYKQFKENYIKEVADEYKQKYPNFPQNLYNAMYNYEVEITD